MISSVVRTVLVYLAVVVAMRLMGKRQLGELQPAELVTTLLISNVASICIDEPDLPLSASLVPIFLITALEILNSTLVWFCPKYAQLLLGKPVTIIRNGEILQDELAQLRITASDLAEALRGKDIFSPKDVYWGVIEPNGSRKEMAKVIKSDLLNIKKEYGVARRTVIEDGEAAVFEEKKIPEMEVMFIMDRFGYARTIDMAAFERNKDAVFNENKYVIPVMNTDKICIFTDTGDLHQLKIKDLPFTKFRDKGTPIDNLCNYDSSKEIIVYITPFERLKNQKMLFVTRQGMMKLVDSEEFQVAKRTVACTKLADDDKLIGMYSTDARVEIYSKFSLDGEIKEEEVVESNQNVIVQTENGVFLKFPLTDIPMKKKSAVGVRGIKLSKDDYIEDVFLLTEGDEFTMEYKGKSISFAKMKTAHRDTKGTKIRV